MAIGTTAAILGSAALGAGTAIASSRSQSSAARNAAQTASDNTAANNQTALDIFNRQTALNEPFRQYEIQQRNALGELFGFDPVGQQAAGPQAGTPNALLAGRVGGQGGMGGVGSTMRAYSPALNIPQGINGNAGGAANDGNDAAMRAYQMRGPMTALNDGGPASASLGNAVPGGIPAAQNKATTYQPVQDTQGTAAGDVATTGGATQGLFDSSIAGADRFNSSLFNPLAQTMFNTERDRVDSNLAASGLLYDSVRQNAVQEAGNRSAQNALSMYLNTMMGSPSTQATNNMTTAAGQYGQSVMGNNTMGANALMQSQQMQGQAQADMWGGIGSAAGFGLGAFNWGGMS